MARAYAFKDPQDVRNLKKISQRFHEYDGGELDPADVSFTTTVNVCLTDDPVAGLGDPDDDAQQFSITTGEAVRLRKLGDDEPLKPFEYDTGKVSWHYFNPVETTNLPADALILTVNDSFNRRVGFTPTPSEVFGTLAESWGGSDFDSPVEITLDDGFTVKGESTLEAYPAPTLAEALASGAAVSCRFIKSKNQWFFFKPTAGGKVIDVYGPVLNVTSSEGVAFYSEMAAGESVASASYPLSITAAPKSQEATGSDTADIWIKFPTVFVTTDETPAWWRKGTNDSTTLYQWETLISGVLTYHAAPVKYYGQVIKGSSGFYLPKYRTINGQRYWEHENGGSFIYYTRKDSDLGYCIGSTLGKFLTTADSEPFAAQTSYPSDALAALMTAQSLTYEKPEWTSSSKFGNYTANASASGTVQFGCGRWIASDGRTLSPPFRFVHAADGTLKKWKGFYTCQAFDVKFSGLNYGEDPVTESNVYFIGDLNAAAGCYTSASAPSTSGSVTFTYRDDGTRGLKANFRYISTESGTETWWLETSAADRTAYTRPEGGTTFTASGSFRSCFGNITQSGSTWTAAGVNATVGTLEFTGDLSTTEPNVFRFKHSITLTFEDYIQGTESKGVLICSPGVIS